MTDRLNVLGQKHNFYVTEATYMSDMSTEHATSKNDGQALNSHLAHTRRKGSRRVLCITTLALAASLVGCGAGGILPADGGEDQATPNPFDIILGE